MGFIKENLRALLHSLKNAGFPFVRQMESSDCGPACLAMVARYYGGRVAIHKLRELADTGLNGATLAGLRDAALSIGFTPKMLDLSYERLSDSVVLPCIAHLSGTHYVVVYGIGRDRVRIADPATGKEIVSRGDFLARWQKKGGPGRGSVLALAPASKIQNDGSEVEALLYLRGIFSRVSSHRQVFFQMLLGILLVGLLQLVLPMIIRLVVDRGIATKDIPIVWALISAYVALAAGAFATEFVKNEIFVFIGRTVNLCALREFALKLMRLPVSFFERRKTGDIIYRMEDIKRIENFLGISLMNAAFSVFAIVTMSVLLFTYNRMVFGIFGGVAVLHSVWMLFQIKKQKAADSLLFQGASESFSATVNILRGMSDIKSNLAEGKMLDEWAGRQKMIYDANTSRLRLMALMRAGGSFSGSLRNAAVTGFSAVSVINGEMSLGQLLAAQYIVGYLGGSLESFLYFVSSLNETRLSVERLVDVESCAEERHAGLPITSSRPVDITIDTLRYSYSRYGGRVVDSFSAVIEGGKTTAIVGESGSGKTTLLKLLSGLYSPEGGKILVGTESLDSVNLREWRAKCAVLLQDSFIFPGTILDNIALSSEFADMVAVEKSAAAAMLSDFIERLPEGYHSKLGADGVGLSQGQRQRLLLARAIYKAPDYLFLDEAMSALDAKTESEVLERLATVMSGKTIVMITHRMVTASMADRIIVMNRGQAVEVGTHSNLLAAGGPYKNLYETATSELTKKQ